MDTSDARRPPSWLPRADRLLAAAAPHARVIGASTPLNLDAELSSLRAAYLRGDVRAPRFVYPSMRHDGDPRRALDQAASRLQPCGPLGAAYAARAREMALEVSLCRAAGTTDLRAFAARRFRSRDAHDAHADALADRWLESPAPDVVADVRSDDEHDPRSLVCCMRAALGARRLPMRVVVSELAALAATGPAVIYVARGRMMSTEDVTRTVLHEIAGHALPRWMAARAPIGLFAHGTANGADDQEGRALTIEERAGLLGPARRVELARRHLACRTVTAGADFVESQRALMNAGAPLDDALRIAARAHRGGGRRGGGCCAGGLARERVYLPAMLRVAALLDRDRSADRVLSVGQVACDCVALLRPWAPHAPHEAGAGWAEALHPGDG